MSSNLRFKWCRLQLSKAVLFVMAAALMLTSYHICYTFAPAPRLATKPYWSLLREGICPDQSPILQGARLVALNIPFPTLEEISARNPAVTFGGTYRPPNCAAREKIAKGSFNRGKLLNIGFTEAEKDYPYDCYVFHDIDQILENDKNLYRCRERPMHLSRFYSAKDYKDAARFGGAVIVRREHFIKMNGFSNEFWGWGGEDEDAYQRAENVWLQPVQAPADTARYTSLLHERDHGNEPNPLMHQMIHPCRVRKLQWLSGLKSLKYEVIAKQDQALYSNVTVDVLQTNTTTKNLISFSVLDKFICLITRGRIL